MNVIKKLTSDRKPKANASDRFNKDFVRKIYLEDNCSNFESADILGISTATFSKLLKKYGITKSPELVSLCRKRVHKEGTRATKSKPKKASNPNSGANGNKFYSTQDKIDYCNSLHGRGNWHFMSREEFIERATIDLIEIKS